jgi:hypothetical protein
MTFAAPIYDPREFELRNYTNPYFTGEQQAAVSLVESRVNGQLDWLAQILGWSGDNYWNNLTSTVNQKRQLLGGSYGVYNSYFFPEIISIQNWDNLVIIVPNDQIQASQNVLLGDNVYPILDTYLNGDTQVLDLGVLPQQFYDDIAANKQIKVQIEQQLPAPFYRPTAGATGDVSFSCGFSGTNLVLYPYYDINHTLPYILNMFFNGSVYYFDQNVYVTYDGVNKNIVSEYDNNKNVWVLRIPPVLASDAAPPSATLVWPVYDSTTATTTEYSLVVSFINWSNPSDWDLTSVLNNFTGVWGNKGGFLPFNFVFDSLSLHGVDEDKSLYLAPVVRGIEFNELLNLIYYQQVTIAFEPPGDPQTGDVWWNQRSGAFSVWIDENNAGICASWVEVEYRTLPDFSEQPSLTYATAADFTAAQATLNVNDYVVIQDITGLSVSNNILGLQGTLTAPGELYTYKLNDIYWVAVKFIVLDETVFNANALNLPYKVPVEIIDSTGLEVDGVTKNYFINNLGFNVGSITSHVVSSVLIKYYSNKSWDISPDTVLKYIGQTSLYTPNPPTPLQGEMWWDYDNPDPEGGTASMFYGDAWVDVNSQPNFSVPPAALSSVPLVVYCDNTLVQNGIPYQTENFSFVYQVSVDGQTVDFTYNNFTPGSQIVPPTITISDSITSEFRFDISYLVYSGIQYKVSPSVYNTQVPLRLWKAQALQCVDNLELLAQQTYINPLRADINSGPGPENWERFFVRLPVYYQRDGFEWQKVNLVCQDFTYYGSNTNPEKMDSPPAGPMPAIYEELVLYNNYFSENLKFIYSEPYWYSNVAIFEGSGGGPYENAQIFPVVEVPFDEFTEGSLVVYEPFHNRRAKVYSTVTEDYGDWEGAYASSSACEQFSGFFTVDLTDGVLEPILPPIWDASIYKYPPTSDNRPDSYFVDSNHFKVGYAYFIADLSAAEEGFFDIEEEYCRRYPTTQPKTGYLTPQSITG